jgi:hypothetical protein
MKKDKAKFFLRKICKEYDVKVIFRKLGKDIDGECDPSANFINIDKNLTAKEMAQAVFHELGHVYCIRKGIWEKFHEDPEYPALKSFKVENWVEWWAKREWDAHGMRKIFGQYQFVYLKKNKKELIKWFRNHFNAPRLS